MRRPRYKRGRAEVTVKLDFYYDSPEAYREVVMEMIRRFETCDVTVGYWGYKRRGTSARVAIVRTGGLT